MYLVTLYSTVSLRIYFPRYRYIGSKQVMRGAYIKLEAVRNTDDAPSNRRPAGPQRNQQDPGLQGWTSRVASDNPETVPFFCRPLQAPRRSQQSPPTPQSPVAVMATTAAIAAIAALPFFFRLPGRAARCRPSEPPALDNPTFGDSVQKFSSGAFWEPFGAKMLLGHLLGTF